MLKVIKNDMEISNTYKDLKECKLFKKGVSLVKEGKAPELEIPKIFWVKKFVSVKDYNQYYKYDNAYCFLGKVPLKGIWLGFLLANSIPMGCSELNMEELRQVDEYRQAYKISPTPFKLVENIKSKIDEVKSNQELPLSGM